MRNCFVDWQVPFVRAFFAFVPTWQRNLFLKEATCILCSVHEKFFWCQADEFDFKAKGAALEGWRLSGGFIVAFHDRLDMYG